MKAVILLLVGVLPCAAELVSFGVRGGLPLSEAFKFERPYNAKTKLYTVGPTLEVHLPFRTSVAFDALYRRLNYDYTPAFSPSVTSLTSFFGVVANSWDFPVMLKHRMSSGSARPYLGVGPTFNRITNVTQFVGGAIRGEIASELRKKSTVGVVFGGGLELRAPILSISPEVRYTRRTADNFDAGSLLRSNRNQLEFLVGITF